MQKENMGRKTENQNFVIPESKVSWHFRISGSTHFKQLEPLQKTWVGKLFHLCWIKTDKGAIISVLSSNSDDSHHNLWGNFLWRSLASADTLDSVYPYSDEVNHKLLCTTEMTAHLLVHVKQGWFCRRCKRYLNNASLAGMETQNQFCDI